MSPSPSVNIRVTNSNPVSKFAAFELCSAQKRVEYMLGDPDPIVTYFLLQTPADMENPRRLSATNTYLCYVIRGIYHAEAEKEPHAKLLCSFRDFDEAREVLIALNGPIEEDEDEE